MPSMLVQFHASPEEVIDFLNSFISGYEVLEVVYDPHFRLKKLVWLLSQQSSIERIAVCPARANMQAVSSQDFARKNPDCLRVDVPRIEGGFLSEGGIEFMSDDVVVSNQWKRIVNRFKRKTKSGAMAINPITGDRGFVKSHRYTDAALKLQENGLKMKPLGGNSLYLLDVTEE
jgi:hypothetical protein